jgi:radical SAM superfamily enzyme YgiQ (UPF0313 family)
MSDITLIFPPSNFLLNQSAFPPLGILYLSAYLKKHNKADVKCIDVGLDGVFKPEEVTSKLVGVSITTPQRFEAYQIAKELKEKGHTLIAGGPHATHMPLECIEAGFDYVVRGEGEIGLSRIVSGDLDKGEDILQYERYLDVNTEIPVPDRTALPVVKYQYFVDDEPTTVLMSSRGCPFACSFCAKLTRKCRIQNAFRTVREILHVKEEFGFKGFMFFDDVFTTDKKRLQQMAFLLNKVVKDEGLKFRCFSRTNLLDKETCELLKAMGVVEVGLGVESGSDKVLATNLKGTTRSANTRAVKLLHESGIRAKAFLIVGLPGETKETITETCKWVEDAKPDDIDVSILQPLPGSPIFDNPERFGLHFEYNDNVTWFKGTPGQYKCAVSTDELSSEKLVQYRDMIEDLYKDKEKLK